MMSCFAKRKICTIVLHLKAYAMARMIVETEKMNYAMESCT